MELRQNATTNLCIYQWVIPHCHDLQINESFHIFVRAIENKVCRKPLIEYLEHGILPEDPRVRDDIMRRAPRISFHDGILFRRSYEGQFCWCLDKEVTQQTIN